MRTMAKCLECIHWRPCFNGKEWDAAIASPCKYFSPETIVGSMTNADRIRVMRDEELAEFLQKADFYCKRDCEKCLRGTACIPMLQWLKQPAKDGDDE